jgi:hypothetical protein
MATRSWQRDLEIADAAKTAAKVESLVTFVRDAIAGKVTLCRLPSTVDSADDYAETVAVAYDADSLSLVPIEDHTLLKRIARDEFIAWRRDIRAERADILARLQQPGRMFA